MTNIYLVFNSVCNDVYKYDFMLVTNCNSYNTLTGQQIWAFKDENVLREPRGIALDKNKNLYVAGSSTNNVVVLSPDGSNCREILTQSDTLVLLII
jgi:sugar lactone lactonase YvrE